MNTSLTNWTVPVEETLVLSALPIQIINFSLSVSLNTYVIVLLMRTRGLDASGIFRLDQCLSEVLFTLHTPLYILCDLNVRNLCFMKPAAFFSSTCMSAHFLFQCCVCFERYLAVVHPVTFLKYKSMKYRIISTVVIWIHALICGIVSVNHFHNLLYIFAGVIYMIILSVHVFLCYSILRVLRKPIPSERKRKGGRVNVAKKKAFEQVFFSLLIYLLQSIPLAVAFAAKEILSSDAFYLAFIIAINLNIAGGTLLSIITLHQMGKLNVKCCLGQS